MYKISEHNPHREGPDEATPTVPINKQTTTTLRVPKTPKGGWVVHKTTGQFDDRENLSQLHLIISANPILKIIKERGAKTPKRLLFPGDSSCDYFFEYLRHFPAGTWAMPQVFCRIIKGLNSNHWLALTAMRFRERRHLGSNGGNSGGGVVTASESNGYGMLRTKEVQRLRAANTAFFDHYVEIRPDDAQMVKLKQRSHNRSKQRSSSDESRASNGDGNNKRKKDGPSVASSSSAAASSDDEPSKKKKKPSTTNSALKIKTLNVAREEEDGGNHYHHYHGHKDSMEGNVSRTVTPTLGGSSGESNNNVTVVTPGLAPTPDSKWKVSACGQFDDRNNIEQLHEVINMNPVLEYIQEKGGAALKKDLFPEGDDFFYEYLENFPAGTWAVPQVFCRAIKKLSSGHWLTRMAMRIKERRQKGNGKYGSLKPKEVMRLKRANPAFFHYYVDAKHSSEESKISGDTESVEHEADNSMESSTHASRDNNADTFDEDDPSSLKRTEHNVPREDSTGGAFVAGGTAMSDPLLQRRILEEHLLRASLQQQQQQRALLMQHFPEHAAALSSPYAAGLGGLSSPDSLSLLAANLMGSGVGQQFSLGAPAPTGDNALAYQTLASLLSSGTGSGYPAGNSLQSLLSQNPAAAAAPHSEQHFAYEKESNYGVYQGEQEASTLDRSKHASLKVGYPTMEDTTDVEASSHETLPEHDYEMKKPPAGRGDFTMLDILAATASAARLEVVSASD